MQTAFTLIEILIVVVILTIAAAVVVPMASSAGSMQIRSAANMVAADLEYAKSMAISRGQSYRVVFDVANDSYQIEEVASGTVIDHPMRPGQNNYIVDFQTDGRLDQVDIVAPTEFNATDAVIFNNLGVPHDGVGNGLNSGQVTLQAGDSTREVSVEPVTGFISVVD
jgi:prepilin-type N-terminal cleavage/methylation domain-containing protein